MPLTRKAVSYFEKRPYPPGEHGRRVRRNSSDFAVRQAEKQKVRWYYDLTEKQLARVYDNAKKRAGRTGEEMLSDMELRLATVVLRSGLAVVGWLWPARSVRPGADHHRPRPAHDPAHRPALRCHAL